jgi:flagellar basal-body rod protein FlgB
MSAFDAGLDALLARMERAMDVMSRRQQLIATNVANLDTPGYRTRDIDFDRALQRAVDERTEGPLRATHPLHSTGEAAGGDAELPQRIEGLMVRNDGNDVSPDREMLALASTRSRYEVAAAIVRMRVRQLRSALSEGRTA